MSLERINLAKKIVEAVQKEVKSCHSIISEIELPFFFENEKETYEKQFGKEKIAEYLKVSNKRMEIRKLIAIEIPDPKLRSDYIKRQIAVAQCGYGECGELTFYTMAKCLMENFQEDVNFILLRSSLDERYNHALIVLGNEFDFNNIQEFKSLSDEFVLVDTKLGVVCQLNKVLESEPLFKKYSEIYQLRNRDTLWAFNIKQKELLLDIVAKATKASQNVKKKLGLGLTTEAKKVVTPTFSLGSERAPIQNELKRITGKEWKYYAPKTSNSIPKVLFTSLDQTEVEGVINSLKELGVVAKKQIIKLDPIKHVAVIDEPQLDQLRKIKMDEPYVQKVLTKINLSSTV